MEEIARFNSSGALYSLPRPPTVDPPIALHASVDTWHKQLGHPNNATLSSLLQNFKIPCDRDSHDPSLCTSCQRGKHVRLPFSESVTQTYFPFSLLHCDVWTSPDRKSVV